MIHFSGHYKLYGSVKETKQVATLIRQELEKSNAALPEDHRRPYEIIEKEYGEKRLGITVNTDEDVDGYHEAQALKDAYRQVVDKIQLRLKAQQPPEVDEEKTRDQFQAAYRKIADGEELSEGELEGLTRLALALNAKYSDVASRILNGVYNYVPSPETDKPIGVSSYLYGSMGDSKRTLKLLRKGKFDVWTGKES